MKTLLTLCFWIAVLSWLALGAGPTIVMTSAAFMIGLICLSMAPLLRK